MCRVVFIIPVRIQRPRQRRQLRLYRQKRKACSLFYTFSLKVSKNQCSMLCKRCTTPASGWIVNHFACTKESWKMSGLATQEHGGYSRAMCRSLIVSFETKVMIPRWKPCPRFNWRRKMFARTESTDPMGFLACARARLIQVQRQHELHCSRSLTGNVPNQKTRLVHF